MLFDLSLKVKAVPVQVISIGDGVILLRGCEATKIVGTGIIDTVRLILAVAANGITCGDFVQMFPQETQQAAEHLIRHLVVRRILVPFEEFEMNDRAEAPLDVFYWHFNKTAKQVREELDARKFVLIGRNEISCNILKSFERVGVYNVDVIEDPLSSSVGQAPSGERVVLSAPKQSVLNAVDLTNVDCVIATSANGALSGLREWNSYCVGKRRNFFPVVLKAHLIYVGPLTVPGESACFHCLMLRQDSVRPKDSDENVIEEAGFNGQDIVSHYPSMSIVAAEFAVMELMKFYGPMKPLRNVGTLLEIDVMGNSLDARKVVKLPRCPTCTPLKREGSINIRKNLIAERQ